jgi:RimJ/RimL family protein N-acetyltransferase
MFEFKIIEKEDLMFLNDVRNDCAFEYLHDSRTFTYEQTTEWFEKTKPNYYLILYENCRIGYFRLTNYSSVNRTIYIGMDLHKDWRGKKLSHKAYQLFIPIIVKKYNLRKIYLEVLSTNIVAKNLYKKLGFQLEGIKKEDVIKNDKLIDSEIMSLYIV